MGAPMQGADMLAGERFAQAAGGDMHSMLPACTHHAQHEPLPKGRGSRGTRTRASQVHHHVLAGIVRGKLDGAGWEHLHDLHGTACMTALRAAPVAAVELAPFVPSPHAMPAANLAACPTAEPTRASQAALPSGNWLVQARTARQACEPPFPIPRPNAPAPPWPGFP